MKRFKNILVFFHPDTRNTSALDKAVELATRNDAKLTLFSVVEKHPDLRRFPESVATHLLTPIRLKQEEWLREIGQPLLDSGLDVVSMVVDGIAFLEVIRHVIRDDIDLVITTADEKKVIHARMFGANTMHLMRKCPCPVWVIKRTHVRPYERVLAAVDPMEDQDASSSLSESILQLAAGMTRSVAGELHVIHAWHLYGERYVNILGWTEQEIQKAKSKEKDQHASCLDTLLGKVDIADLKPHLHLVEGHPVESIARMIIEQDIDLLVMGTVCRTGIAGFLIGNTAEEILNQVDCSVLTLKPEGFKTPVSLRDD